MIRLTVPHLTYDDVGELKDVINSGFLTKGPYNQRFEEAVASYLGVRYAVSTSSGTAALHLALIASGVGHGDEVLVPDFTFPATANVVEHRGAKPVLVDIDIDTFNIMASDTERKVTGKTKAIMPVHQFGNPAPMDEILTVARKYGLKVIEDAACAIGAEYRGKKCGTIGDVGCFSFHPRKVITTGEGGMLVTNDKGLAEKCRSLRDHGMVQKDGRRDFVYAGYNYRLSELHAAVGIAQMKRLEEILDGRMKLSSLYASSLQGLKGVGVPSESPQGKHIYQSYVVVLGDNVDRDYVMKELYQAGVETTIGGNAVHALEYYVKKYGYLRGEVPNSLRAFEKSLALPFYPSMKVEDVSFVVQALEALI